MLYDDHVKIYHRLFFIKILSHILKKKQKKISIKNPWNSFLKLL